MRRFRRGAGSGAKVYLVGMSIQAVRERLHRHIDEVDERELERLAALVLGDGGEERAMPLGPSVTNEEGDARLREGLAQVSRGETVTLKKFLGRVESLKEARVPR